MSFYLFINIFCYLHQSDEDEDDADSAELGLDNVGGVFVVMCGGLALSCITACCEFLWKARKLATEEGVSVLNKFTICDEFHTHIHHQYYGNNYFWYFELEKFFFTCVF